MALPTNTRSAPSKPSEFLDQVMLSLHKRNKALKHKLSSISVDQVQDRRDGVEVRCVKIACVQSRSPHVILNIIAWDDRWLSMTAGSRFKNKPWTWIEQMQGRVLSTTPGVDVVTVLEQSLAAIAPPSQHPDRDLRSIWTPLLAQGPQVAS